MAGLKAKGDLAELMIAADLRRQGYRILFPYGEDSPYDLVIERDDGRFERVQVKHTTPRDGILEVRSRTLSLTSGRVLSTTRYTAREIDWLAAWNPVGGGCFYIPAAELGEGMSTFTLRLAPARNNQRRGVRMAGDYALLR